MNVNECPILVSSSDAYADIWPAFFHILRREWPEYRGRIVLNTDTRDFSFDGLDIVCTRACRDGRRPFGATLGLSLDAVPGDVFLMMMIDYFFEGPVDTAALQRYLDAFLAGGASAFFLLPQIAPSNPVPGCPGVEEMDIPRASGFAIQTLFSFQAAFWRKDEMRKFVADWEDPWFAEYFGCMRAQILRPRFWKLADSVRLPIPYDRSGVLHGGGKWLMRAADRIDFAGVPIDLEKSKSERGICRECEHPYLARQLGELHRLPARIIAWIRSKRQLRSIRRQGPRS